VLKKWEKREREGTLNEGFLFSFSHTLMLLVWDALFAGFPVDPPNDQLESCSLYDIPYIVPNV
jgi:hypothetical protein